MDKRKAIQIMTKAAALYHANLEGQKILFLYGVPAEVKRQIQTPGSRLLSMKSVWIIGWQKGILILRKMAQRGRSWIYWKI